MWGDCMADDILIDAKSINTLCIELKGFEKEVGMATYRAINRTIDRVVTKVGRIVPQHYAIKSKDVKESFENGIKRPSYRKLEASLTSRGHTLSLAHFPHSPQAPSRRKYKVKATIKKSSGRKVIQPVKKGELTLKPFIMSTGADPADKTKIPYNVFRRDSKRRMDLVVPRTLSIPQMITNSGVADEVSEFAAEVLSERLQHEIEREMTSIGGKLR